MIAHNGEPLPPTVVADIAWVGVAINADQWWIAESTPRGFLLSDAAVDWVETAANEEKP